MIQLVSDFWFLEILSMDLNIMGDVNLLLFDNYPYLLGSIFSKIYWAKDFAWKNCY